MKPAKVKDFCAPPAFHRGCGRKFPIFAEKPHKTSLRYFRSHYNIRKANLSTNGAPRKSAGRRAVPVAGLYAKYPTEPMASAEKNVPTYMSLPSSSP